jgi:hypothetical protein
MPGPTTQLTETSLRGQRPRWRWTDETVAAIVSVTVALVAGLVMTAAEPARVDQLSITNPSDHEIRVRVGNLQLADVQAGTTRQYRGVFDEGQRWTFTFASQGIEAGAIEIDRSELAGDDWTVVIPDDVVHTLRSAPIEPVPVPESTD